MSGPFQCRCDGPRLSPSGRCSCFLLMTAAAYADWLRAAAQRKDPLRNPAGHWIDYCKRKAQADKKEDG